MSDIRKSKGDVIQIVAPSTLTSGVPILTGKVFGVPVTDAASGASAAIEVTGEHRLPKVASGGITFSRGDKVYWNSGTSKATATATDALVGVCTVAAADADATVDTLLIGQSVDVVDADAIAGAAAGTYAGHLVRTSGTAIAYKKANFAGTAAPSATDDSAADYAVGSFWNDTTNDRAYVCLDATASAAVWREISSPKVNLAGTAAPGANDDATAGYGVASRWMDVTNDRAYVCLDSTNGAAVWLPAGLPLKSGTVNVASGASTGTASVGAALNGFPVVVTLTTHSGAIAAADAYFKAAIAAGTLTVTVLDLAGAPQNASSNLAFFYHIVGTI